MKSNIILKVCTKCKQNKPTNDFCIYNNYCKSCRRENLREWKKKNPETVNKYYLKYREESITKSKKWVEDFKKQYGVSYWTWYYRNNKQKCKERSRRNAQNPKSKEYQKKYRLERREDLNEKRRSWCREFFLKWGYYPGHKKIYQLGTSWLDSHRKKDFQKEMTAISFEKKRLGLLYNKKKWTYEYIQNIFDQPYHTPPTPTYSKEDLIELGDL